MMGGAPLVKILLLRVVDVIMVATAIVLLVNIFGLAMRAMKEIQTRE